VEDNGTAVYLDPVVDGAAGDNRGQREVDPRSAAGRAALADPPPAPPPPPTEPTAAAPPDRRRPRRRLFLAVGTVLVLVAGGIATWLWVLTHWFVGVAAADGDDRVAVFRGFDTELLGMDLYRVDDVTDIALDDLSSYDQNNVRRGIDAGDADDAQRIVDDLHAAALPECPSPSAEPTPQPSPEPTPEPSLPAPDGAAPAPETGAAPAPTTTTTATTTSSTPTTAPEPGVGCREAE
jgi:protein phosphatase